MADLLGIASIIGATVEFHDDAGAIVTTGVVVVNWIAFLP